MQGVKRMTGTGSATDKTGKSKPVSKKASAAKKRKNKAEGQNRGIIRANEGYPIQTFLDICNITQPTLSNWREMGLRIRETTTCRPFVWGQDFLDWLATRPIRKRRQKLEAVGEPSLAAVDTEVVVTPPAEFGETAVAE